MKSVSGVDNLVPARSITIHILVKALAGLALEATYAWDAGKLLGQSRHVYAIGRLSKLGFVTRTELQEGLSETPNWYLENLDRLWS